MNNLRTLTCICVIAALAICSEAAAAGPRNGIGASFGVVGAAEGGSMTRGLSLGMDAQFVVDQRWSLNPYLMVSAERNTDSQSVADGLAGMQLRCWFDDWFLGGQFFAHDRLQIDNGTVQSSNYGPALGVVGGFEYASGWGAGMQADLFESTNIQGVQRSAVRLYMTYRWY